jgi:PAS domain-containing protein
MKKRVEFPVSLDILVLTASLTLTFVLWRIALTFPADQTPLYIFIIGIIASFLLFGMVFALSRAEKKSGELDIEHSRLVSAIESIPVGILITDTLGNIVMLNYGVSEVLSEVGEEWTLKSLDERLKDSFPLMEMYNEVLKNKRTSKWKRVAYGSKKLDIFLSPIFSEEKGLLGVLILLK